MHRNYLRIISQFIVVAFLILYGGSFCNAANWYVDKDATGSHNGTSWANAWTSLGAITGVTGGDTVYISGGTTGQTYSGAWSPAGGSSGNSRVTYKIGQDAGHNGMVTFTGTITLPSYVVIDGNYNGTQAFTTSAIIGLNTHYATVKYVVTYSSWAWNYDVQYAEIAYNIFSSLANPLDADHAISFNGSTTVSAWDVNLVHHNTFYLAHDTDGSGYGTDGLQNITSASIYNNSFIGVPKAGARGNHQDGIQTDGQYMKIYNNTFSDMGNYAVFFELYGNVSNVRIYNNVFYMTESRFNGGGQLAIAIGRSDGASGTVHITNYIVANNTCVDFNNNREVIGLTSGSQTVWDSSTVVYNNVVYRTTGSGDFDIPSAATGYNSPTNKRVASSATNIFMNYTGHDYHLKSTDTVLKDQGVSTPSSYFLTDKDGNNRTGTWSIGAYQYGSGSQDTNTPASNMTDSPSGGCFIATAAYGSLDPHVYVLRNFRDRYLLTNFPGQVFLDSYYRYSPPLADFIREHETLKIATKWTLTAVVCGIEHPYSAVSILLMIPAGIVLVHRKKKINRSF